jgi:hypothetical protein
LIKDELLVYKRGVLLTYNNGDSRALVEFNTSDNTANLLIWGSAKEAFSCKLIDSLETLNQDENYKILIPLDKNYNTYITYKALKGYDNNPNYDKYFDGESKKYFNISEYLTGIERQRMNEKQNIYIDKSQNFHGNGIITGGTGDNHSIQGTIINSDSRAKIDELTKSIDEIKSKVMGYEVDVNLKIKAYDELQEIRKLLENLDTTNAKEKGKLKEYLSKAKNGGTKVLELANEVKDKVELIEWVQEKAIPLLTGLGAAGVLG